MKKFHEMTIHEQAIHINQILRFESDGVFWIKSFPGRVKVGDQAGYVITIRNRRHYVIKINRRVYFIHRLRWLAENGEWPKGQIDHKDRNTLNNKMDNIREATQSQQNANRRPFRDRKFKGVYDNGNKWRARIGLKRKVINLGSFSSETEAAKRYDEEAIKYFGEFALTNKSLGLLPPC